MATTGTRFLASDMARCSFRGLPRKQHRQRHFANAAQIFSLSFQSKFDYFLFSSTSKAVVSISSVRSDGLYVYVWFEIGKHAAQPSLRHKTYRSAWLASIDSGLFLGSYHQNFSFSRKIADEVIGFFHFLTVFLQIDNKIPFLSVKYMKYFVPSMSDDQMNTCFKQLFIDTTAISFTSSSFPPVPVLPCNLCQSGTREIWTRCVIPIVV